MRKVLVLLLTLVLMVPLGSQARAADLDTNDEDAQGVKTAKIVYQDVPKNHRFYKEIMYLLEKGVIEPGTRFGINDKVTREAAAVMIAKAVGLDGKKSQTKFKDVPESRPSSGYIDSAVKSGIISGYPDGTFRPNGIVTRGHMAAFITRAFELTKQADVSFKDVPKGSAAYGSVKQMIYSNITAGYPDGTFRPHESLSKAQIAAFIARAMNPAFRPAPKRKVYLDPVTKDIMLNNITTFMTKSEVVAILGKSQREYMSNEFNNGLTQEYPGMIIRYDGKYVSSIMADVSENEFFNEILPDFKGRKFTDRKGMYALYSKEAAVVAIYKYENYKTSIYLLWGGDFDSMLEMGEYVELK